MDRRTRTDEKVSRLVEAYNEVIKELGKHASKVTRKYIFELVVKKEGVYYTQETAIRIMNKLTRNNANGGK